MKKEISPELYNYNKFPGPSFARVGDKVVAEQIQLDLVENYKEAFDQTAFGQRFSQLMLKFDYIVGDWGNEQLRLKGFYKDNRKVASEQKIGRLDDYLTEFCNFGCAYFILENPNPQELPVELEDKPARRRRNRSRNRNRQQDAAGKQSQNQKQQGTKGTKKQDSKKQEQKRQENKKQVQKAAFTIRNEEKSSQIRKKKTDRKPDQPRKKASQEPKETKRGFVIRQK
ncbi:TPA: DUF1027 domain-containing protein [Streptococcus suis]|nr:DUF1027 domain-containing protein [Streptococcus suis]